MPVVIAVDLITGRYDAAGAGDRDAAEWPPHPARVFCALLAGARSDEEREALRWLERQPPPLVHAAGSATGHTRTGYVVTNARPNSNGGSQFHIGRGNAERSRAAAVPTTAAVSFVWVDADVSEQTVATLDRLARRVPYLGRSTGLAALHARSSGVIYLSDGQVEYRPAAVGERRRAEHHLRVPYTGYLDTLDELYDAGRSAWEDSRIVRYIRADPESVDDLASARSAVPSVYTDLVVLRFRGLKPDGRLTARFTEGLRRALMKATVDPLPTALHGHDADDRPHVAFLALPDVGHEHADGHLLGLAVALPDLPAGERKQILAGLLHGMRRQDTAEECVLVVRVPGIGQVELEYSPGLVKPWGTQPERWRAGSQSWATVTPVVLDRYPKRGQAEAEIQRSCLRLGLPAPQSINVRTAPTLRGALNLRPNDLPERARGRLYRHVELSFDRKVSGPILLGAGRYLGVGLFAPVAEKPGATERAVIGGAVSRAAGAREATIEGAT